MVRQVLLLIFLAGLAFCSEVPQGACLSEDEWHQCELFIRTRAKSFFSQGINYIDAGQGHPCAIQRDPQTGFIYVHLDGKDDSVIGIGGFKRVTQSILYGDRSELVARCQGWNSLIREAEVLSKLETSSGIVHMKSFIKLPDGENSIVLEYYNAGSLVGRPKKNQKISKKELLPVVRDLLEGLKNLHAAGYIHRDLHRGNVLFNRKKGKLRAALTDFGLALRMDEQPDAKTSIQLTGLAPEALVKQNSRIDRKKAEAYSLGVLLYYMVFNKRPPWCTTVRLSRGSSDMAKARLHSNVRKQYKKTVAHTKSMRGIRGDLAHVVLQLLHPNPKKRLYLDSAVHQINAIAKRRSIRVDLK